VPSYRKIPVKKPGPGQLLVHVKYSGVCHSDVHAMKADWDVPAQLPLVGGHEGVGEVVAIGDGVEGWDLGDWTGIKWINNACRKCDMCLSGNEQICFDPALSGYTCDGSFQEYALTQAWSSVKVPKDCDLAAVAPIHCAGLTVYKGLKAAGAKAGDYMAVVGAGGGLGSYALAYAKAMVG
jgi:alcohol dehydrogenase, propanol-preferring